MMDFTSKRLLENPSKSKLSATFDLTNKKMMHEMYNKLTSLAELDSIALQELND